MKSARDRDAADRIGIDTMPTMPKVAPQSLVRAARFSGTLVLLLAGLMLVGSLVWAARTAFFAASAKSRTASVVASNETDAGLFRTTYRFDPNPDAANPTGPEPLTNTFVWNEVSLRDVGTTERVLVSPTDPLDVRRDRWTIWLGPLLVGASALFKTAIGCVSLFVVPAIVHRRTRQSRPAT